ncbi:hypothetical protein V2J09_000821 [Rumex salicifolius]
MLWIYYALLKTNSFLLITINGAGCVIETIYISIFLTFAPKQAKMGTIKILVLLNMVGFSSILVGCNYLAKASIRVAVLGWLCVAFSVVVFAAPLSIIRSVIRTKSVEFMPFPLSLSLTISAVMWFMYGLLQKDLYIVLPNVVGFAFGLAQMVMYGIYRKHGKVVEDLEKKVPESMGDCSPVEKNELSINVETHSMCSLPVIDVTERAALAVAEAQNADIIEEVRNDVHVHDPPIDISRGTHEYQTGCFTASPAIGLTTVLPVMTYAG